MKITEFLKHNYRHFNAAALIDAAEGYKTHLNEGGKMMVTLAGAMSTAELGISLAEMMQPEIIRGYAKQATGEKYLVNPHK